MKIAMICPRGVPYTFGGAERLWEGTVDAFNRLTPHEATIVELPSPERSFADIVKSYSNFDALDLGDFDLVISGKYPAWMVRHPRHVVYMCHTLRGLYDTYDPSLPQLAQPTSLPGIELQRAMMGMKPGTTGARHEILAVASSVVDQLRTNHPDLAFPGPLIRDVVHWLDADALHPQRIARHLAISRTVAGRPGYFPPGVDIGVVVPPSALPGLHTGGFECFFTASRLDQPKRISLLIEAMALLPSSATLRIAGSGPAHSALWALANGDPRIAFLGRISDQELVDEYAAALAVPFVPLDEDLGLITLEAQMSGKPVITCTDSGGTAELVEDLVDGYVVSPTPAAIAEAMSSLLANPAAAKQMGAHAKTRAEQVTWDSVVQAILAEPKRRPARAPRNKIVALSTYSALPARHGGQVRINRLYRALATHHDVHLIALSDGHSSSCEVAPGLWQTIVEMPPVYHQLTSDLTKLVGAHTGDISATLAGRISDDFRRVTNHALEGAGGVVLAHPYLFPMLSGLDPSFPVVYDSHNAEWSLKQSMYAPTDVGRALAGAVTDVERALLRRANLVTATSESDVDQLKVITTTLAEFAVVPNGGDFSTTNFVTGGQRRQTRRDYLAALQNDGVGVGTEHVAVFVGSGHLPNIEAAHVVLRAAAELPNVLFILIGSHVLGLQGSPVGPNVLARGVVNHEEMDLILSLASVALNPMAAGSGTNIKMLDYFAAGTPTVSSAVGARGIPVEHERDLIITDDDPVPAIRRVLSDPDAADRRAVAARRVAEPFDWEEVGQRFAELVSSNLLVQ